MMRALRALALIAATLSAWNCPTRADDRLASLKEHYRRPAAIPFPASAPYSPQMATLGKMLFFDPRLSGAQNLSCASCHNPSFGYEVPVPGADRVGEHAVGPQGADGAQRRLYADILLGRPRQVARGSGAGTDHRVGGDARQVPRDRQLGSRTFPNTRIGSAGCFPADGVTKDNVLTAIATYERTVVDRLGAVRSLGRRRRKRDLRHAKRGFELFNGKAGCAGCHTGWNFTDNKFHDVGFADDDIGRGKSRTRQSEAQHAFKTPGLRNLIYRAPFGHAGQSPDLRSIIAFYENRWRREGRRSRRSFKPFSLSDGETDDLLAFLHALTAEKVETPLPNLPN